LLPELEKLIAVQEIDKVIWDLTHDLEQLPEGLKEGEAALVALKADYDALARELESLKSQRREMEAEMMDLEEAIKKSRQRLMKIENNIEYKAMIKEIAFKEDQRDQRETRILELIDLIEAQERQLADQEQLLADQEERIAVQRQTVEQEVQQLKQRLGGLEKDQKVLRKGVSASLLKRYDFIRQRRNGTAIALVREGVCFECHMNILPQQFIDLQKGQEILQCPHCQRILYWLGDDEVAEEAV
jgi:predicted  nucleic acid-binding Zn-ribbon protein